MAPQNDHTEETESPLNDGMLDVRGACEFTRLSRAELYAAMARQELRYFNYGKRRLIAKRDLLAWLDSRLVPSSGPQS
jgi:hypothetical protein